MTMNIGEDMSKGKTKLSNKVKMKLYKLIENQECF
jgi:hypothetical protein